MDTCRRFHESEKSEKILTRDSLSHTWPRSSRSFVLVCVSVPSPGVSPQRTQNGGLHVWCVAGDGTQALSVRLYLSLSWGGYYLIPQCCLLQMQPWKMAWVTVVEAPHYWYPLQEWVGHSGPEVGWPFSTTSISADLASQTGPMMPTIL